MGEWRTIDSAPKDGTWILVYEAQDGHDDPSVHVVQWGQPEWGGGDLTWVTMALGPNPDTYNPHPVTHWMSLPSPPP